MSNSPGDAKERVLFEGQRVTIIANAAGALALLVFLQSVWLSAGAVSLKRFALYGIAAFAVGAGVALLGYVARYWALSKNQLNAGLFYQIAHLWIPLLAVVCFVLGVILPVIGGLDSLGSQPDRPTQTVPKRR
jgi:hypothetical protein